MAKKRKFSKRTRPCIVGKVGKVREEISRIIPDKEERKAYLDALAKEFDRLMLECGV